MDEAAVADKKKKEALDQEIELVKKEYEEKIKKKRDKANEKIKDQGQNGSKEQKQGGADEEKEAEKEKDEKVLAIGCRRENIANVASDQCCYRKAKGCNQRRHAPNICIA